MTSPELVLVDTSVWIATLRRGGDVACVKALDELLSRGAVATCEVVIVEVLAGAASEARLADVEMELRALVRLSMDDVGHEAGRCGWSLRRRGLTIPATDLLIAATAYAHGASLLHRDAHLKAVAECMGLRQTEV